MSGEDAKIYEEHGYYYVLFFGSIYGPYATYKIALEAEDRLWKEWVKAQLKAREY